MTHIDIREILPAGARALSVANLSVTGVAYRSDSVRVGDVFFCIPGGQADGHDFAADAARNGAVALVVERELGLEVPQFVVPSARAALAAAAARFYGEPSTKLLLAGITGTNGKTTTTYLLDSILREAGYATGIIGTVETRIAGRRLDSARTTPESADLQALLAAMVGERVGAVSMEVSSHAIDLGRVDATHFAVAGFTNLTQDHLDYHHTLEEYASVKKRLFTDLDVVSRVVDVDDAFGKSLGDEVPGALRVGRAASAQIRAVDERPDASGTLFTLKTPSRSAALRLPLAGSYNVSNALLAAGCALELGIDLDTVVEGLSHAPQVPGRLEQVDCGQSFLVLVDYAHTPDSLAKALAAVRAVTEGRVIVVFGCGGDRDPSKRAPMGEAAGRGADRLFITSDNPRSEDPATIIAAVEVGARNCRADYAVEVDRRGAIARAIADAKPGDAVLIAGKGHEDYQIFAHETIHFDDREVAREVLGGC